jgi:hypothetical protein
MKYLYLPMFAFVASCGGPESLHLMSASNADASAMDIAPAAAAFVPIIGTGWDSAAQKFKVDCITADLVELPPATGGEVEIRKSLTSSDVMSEVGFSMNAKARYGLMSGSLKANLARSSTASELSRVWIYSTRANSVIEKLDLRHGVNLNFAGQSAVTNSNWREVCGDEVVFQTLRGGQFFLVYRLDFDSAEAKSAVDARAAASAPIGELNASLHSMQRMLAEHASLTVEAYQFGGDPTGVSYIVSGLDAKLEAAGDSARTLMECGNMNLAACDVFVQRAIDYGSNKSHPNAFPQQIARAPAPLMYTTVPWSSIGQGIGMTALSSSVVNAARQQLSAAFDAAMAYKTRLDAISGSRWSTDTQLALATEQRVSVNAYLGEIWQAVESCFDQLRPDPHDPTTFAPDLSEECRTQALAIDNKKGAYLRLPEELAKNQQDRVMMQTWLQLNGMTGTDPTVNKMQIGEAQCGVTSWTGICVFNDKLGLSSYTMPESMLSRWRDPNIFRRLGYPTESAHDDRLGQGTAMTFQNGAMVATRRGTFLMPLEHFDAWQSNVRFPTGYLGEVCGDEETLQNYGSWHYSGPAVRFANGYLVRDYNFWALVPAHPAGACP